MKHQFLLSFLAAATGLASQPPCGYALDFDGVNDQVISTSNFDMSVFTIEGWCKLPASFSSGRWGGLYAWGSENAASWEIAVGSTSGTTSPGIQCQINWGRSGLRYSGFQTRLLHDSWRHFAVSYDGAVVRMFVDGLLEYQASWNLPVLPGGSHMALGNNFPGADEHMAGLLDEIRIWSVVRTEADIRANMSATLSPQPGLFAYYRFDEGSGQTVLDSSGNGRHAYLGSSPSPDAGDPTYVPTSAPLGCPWSILGCGLPGTSGQPVLRGSGLLQSGATLVFDLISARPASLAVLVLSHPGVPLTPVSLFGGVLKPVPILATIVVSTSPSGTVQVSLPLNVPSIPPGIEFAAQSVVVDPLATQGFAFSGAISARS